MSDQTRSLRNLNIPGIVVVDEISKIRDRLKQALDADDFSYLEQEAWTSISILREIETDIAKMWADLPRVDKWKTKYGSSAWWVKHHHDTLISFLIDEIGVLDKEEVAHWAHSTGKDPFEFIEDFISRNEHRPWGAELKRDLTEWGYFAL